MLFKFQLANLVLNVFSAVVVVKTLMLYEACIFKYSLVFKRLHLIQVTVFACNVHGFEPYFYIICPPGMGPDDISHFHQTLEVHLLLSFF